MSNIDFPIKKGDYFILFIAIIAFYISLKSIITEILKLKNKFKIIIFSNEGITINDLNYEWKTIKKQKILTKNTSNNNEESDFYLYFEFKKEIIEIKMNNYNTNLDEMNDILKKFTSMKSKLNTNSINSQSIFEEIIGYEEYFELNNEESEEEIKKTLKICEENKVDLKEYCIKNLLTETEKIHFIYYTLSDDYEKWDAFLTEEYLRIYELCIKENLLKELYPILEDIFIEDIDSKEAEKIREFILNQLNSKNKIIQLKSMNLFHNWVDETILNKNPHIKNKLKELLKDENWKIRWYAHNILIENKVLVEKLSIWDRLRAKYFK